MMQINIKRQPGDLTHNGHTHQGWQPCDYEHFDNFAALQYRTRHLDASGVRWEYGRATRRALERMGVIR